MSVLPSTFDSGQPPSGQPQLVVTVNAGSTSLRLDAFEWAGTNKSARLLATEHAETADSREQTLSTWFARFPSPHRILHRIVHGGTFSAPQVLHKDILAELSRWTELAPLHNGPALQLVHSCRLHGIEDAQQIGVFDTAAFAELPAVATRYAIPDLNTALPIRRYGFHGLAHQSQYHQWQQQLQQDREENHSASDNTTSRIISLQLGGGCSISARRGDQIIDCSMGFTPLEGLPMATRCGDIDAGLLLYLLRHDYTAANLDDLLNRQSGLTGVSGISGDMKKLLASPDAAARQAIDLFCYRVRKQLGAYIAALGGVDVILFGGGIGEHAAPVREQILHGLGYLGIDIDPSKNATIKARPAQIQTPGSRCQIWIVAVDEAREMLIEAAPLL